MQYKLTKSFFTVLQNYYSSLWTKVACKILLKKVQEKVYNISIILQPTVEVSNVYPTPSSIFICN